MFFVLNLSRFIFVVSWLAYFLSWILQKNNTSLFFLLTKSSNPTTSLTHNENLREYVSVYIYIFFFMIWGFMTLTPWKLDRGYDLLPSKYIPWLSVTPASFIFHENCSSASSIYATFFGQRDHLAPIPQLSSPAITTSRENHMHERRGGNSRNQVLMKLWSCISLR